MFLLLFIVENCCWQHEGDAEFSAFLHVTCTISPSQAWTRRRGCTLALASTLRHASALVSGSQTLLLTAVGCLKARAKDDKERSVLFLFLLYEDNSCSLFAVIRLAMHLFDHSVYQVPVREGAAQAISRLLVFLVQERLSLSSVGELMPVLCSLLTDPSSDVRRRALRFVKLLAKVSHYPYCSVLLLFVIEMQVHNHFERNKIGCYYLTFS